MNGEREEDRRDGKWEKIGELSRWGETIPNFYDKFDKKKKKGEISLPYVRAHTRVRVNRQVALWTSSTPRKPFSLHEQSLSQWRCPW